MKKKFSSFEEGFGEVLSLVGSLSQSLAHCENIIDDILANRESYHTLPDPPVLDGLELEERVTNVWSYICDISHGGRNWVIFEAPNGWKVDWRYRTHGGLELAVRHINRTCEFFIHRPSGREEKPSTLQRDLVSSGWIPEEGEPFLPAEADGEKLLRFLRKQGHIPSPHFEEKMLVPSTVSVMEQANGELARVEFAVDSDQVWKFLINLQTWKFQPVTGWNRCADADNVNAARYHLYEILSGTFQAGTIVEVDFRHVDDGRIHVVLHPSKDNKEETSAIIFCLFLREP